MRQCGRCMSKFDSSERLINSSSNSEFVNDVYYYGIKCLFEASFECLLQFDADVVFNLVLVLLFKIVLQSSAWTLCGETHLQITNVYLFKQQYPISFTWSQKSCFLKTTKLPYLNTYLLL